MENDPAWRDCRNFKMNTDYTLRVFSPRNITILSNDKTMYSEFIYFLLVFPLMSLYTQYKDDGLEKILLFGLLTMERLWRRYGK